MEGYGYRSWRYRPACEGEKGGVVIQVHNSGHVEIHEGIVDIDLDQATMDAAVDNPLAEEKARPKYSRPLRANMALHKSMAVQHALLANPRTAKEVAVVQMIAGSGWRDSVTLTLHDCVKRFADEESQPSTFASIEAEARALSKALGQSFDADAPDLCTQLIANRSSDVHWYEAVKKLSNPQLDRLHLLLTTMCFGQDDCDELDTDENSLFNSAATSPARVRAETTGKRTRPRTIARPLKENQMPDNRYELNADRADQEASPAESTDLATTYEKAAAPLFPLEWEWQQFDAATRESAAQHVVYMFERPAYSENQDQAFRDKAAEWDFQQIDLCNLPDYTDRLVKGEAFQDIWDRLIEDTTQAYCVGTLMRGHAHLAMSMKTGPNLPSTIACKRGGSVR